jgi:[acyl-carrier-protein] S-malonyltransferase
MSDKIALIFPGQGSQEVGMGRELAEAMPPARQVFEEADDILGFKLSQLCFSGPEGDLNDTINTQAAIFTTSIAALIALRATGFEQDVQFVSGHSLGEYSAYVAAGVLSFADGLRLVRERGRLMKHAGELNPGGMAAILKLDDEAVRQICEQVTTDSEFGTLQVANFNSPGQVVISGHNAAVDRGIELAKAAKARRAVKLPVSIAAHSQLMQVITDQFSQAVANAVLNLPGIAVVGNIGAVPLDSIEAIRSEMNGQLTGPVRWTESINYMIAQGVSTFIEVGPKEVLTGLVRRINKQVNTYNVQLPNDISKLLDR